MSTPNVSVAQMRLRRLTPQQVKNRQAILNKVRNFWIKGVLESSLHDQVLIELGLEEHPDAVVSSWNMELKTAGETQKPLPKGTKAISIFDQLGEGRTLLILGEPGAGKTTTLLSLTRDLVNRAEQGLDYRIPIVFNLSSWAGKKQTIADWLVAELNLQYQVPKPIGEDWLKQQELLLLLDGLDEVKAEHRQSCVAALNDFHQNYAPEMVVCSRIQDYSALSKRLKFQSAIYLRSLTLKQARYYLNSLKADLTGLKALIAGDIALQELAKSPLMLNIMVLAYEGVAVEDLPKTGVVEERRKQLFDAYIERMFRRPTRLKSSQRYSEAQSIRWLTWLAQRMVQQSQTVFFIERMQPTWLQTQGKKILYRLGSFLIGGLSVGLVSGLISGLSYLLIHPLISGLSFGLISGIISAWGKAEIKTVETLKWSWKEVKNSLISAVIFGLSVGLSVGLISGLLAGLVGGLTFGLIVGLISGLSVGLSVGLISGLVNGMKGSAIVTKTVSNQGIYRTVRNAGIMGLIIGLIVGLSVGLYYTLSVGLIYGLSVGLVSWLIVGLISGMKGSAIVTKTIPNQGIYRTARNAGIIGLTIGLIYGLIYGLIVGAIFERILALRGLNYRLIIRLIVGLIYGLNYGLIAVILGGGKACIQHFSLRLIFFSNGYIPWNYARFLDYASDRIFLQKVGGGYIFIHRLLLEHFAQIKLKS